MENDQEIFRWLGGVRGEGGGEKQAEGAPSPPIRHQFGANDHHLPLG